MSTSLRSILQGCCRFAIGLAFLGMPACADSNKDTEQIAAPASTGNPSANLDQCSNGKITATTDCVWLNGNLNINNSHYFEGESVAYRMRFDNLLTNGSNYDVIIEWDSSVGNAQAGHHALDYITSFDHSEATANPCLGVAGCNPSTHSTFAMPLDPRVLAGPDDLPGTADDITQIPGVFTLYGGTITAVSDYGFRGDFSNGSKTSITVSFLATVNNPVLAWGGHIGTRADWAPELTAVHIPGSPYHTMLVSLNGSGGAQDRSLSAAAVYALPELTVIKHVINDNGRTAVASDFTLTVTATNPDPATFAGAESPGTKVYLDPGAYAVTEGAHEGYEVTYSAGCTGTLDYDQTATCTVTNDDINRCFGVTCPPPSSECLEDGICNENTGECEYAPKPADTPCTDDGEVCTDDVCNDVGECVHPAGHVGTLCRAADGICDVPERCDGISTTCPADGYAGRALLCRGASGECDAPEYCTGTSALCPDDAKLLTLCRAAAGFCDNAEYCDGVHDLCPPDVFANGERLCRDSAGICDIPEFCSGQSPDCPVDVFQPDLVECRARDGVCDIPEFCTGIGPLCPNDGFVPPSVTCRPSAGICDPAEYCTGAAADCPPDILDEGRLCRDSDGVCDTPEFCDGLRPGCPEDRFLPPDEVCRDSAGICDTPERCTGVGPDCPRDGFLDGTECRHSEGICDVPEFCNGLGPACPDDRFEPDTELCRGPDGICDVPEYCTGVGPLCPNDGFAYGIECRAADGICDIPEFCTGAAPDCPQDSFVPETEVCRERAGICDLPEYCTGYQADCPGDIYAYGIECRESAGICDIPELCNGAQPDCPTDEFAPRTELCREAEGICDRPEYCTGIAADCPADILAPQGTICRESTGECDPEEVCTGFDISCPENVDDICTACGAKFYDLDLDLNRDEEEALLEGWEITISNPSLLMTTFTDENGAWSFENLPAGEYVICESVPLEENWIQTAPPEDCYELTIPSEEAEQCTLDFGNVCLGAGGARSAGFWSNKNGMAAFMNTDRGASALAMLVSLNLVDGNGNAFNPTSYMQFKEWLVKRTARNAAYQLSGQFAAAALNVMKLGVDPDRMVWVPHALGADDLGFISVMDLLEEVDRELGLHPYTPSGSLYRAYQEGLTEGLDDLNNNLNFLQFEPCDFSFPVLELKHR